uniref:CCHC-type domain-containing protein n=1 Tax=Phytophthora fragariae TaxID=53985 RepID=A0A6A3F9R0_9STRA|nr:hypothetical protein PF009_g8802 [Phytophthora fragariae]
MIGVSDATRRLRQAEQACMQVANLQPQATVLRAAQVSYVNEGQGRKAGRKKPQGAKMEELAKKKASPECSNCSKLGHWYAECTATTVVQQGRSVQHVASTTTKIDSPVYSPTTPTCSHEVSSSAATNSGMTSQQHLRQQDVHCVEDLHRE